MSDLKNRHADHVQAELNRIGERLRAPDPFQHAALYAAQQALCWAAQPEAFASPVDTIVDNAGGVGDCSPEAHRPSFSDTHDHWRLYAPQRDCLPLSEDS